MKKAFTLVEMLVVIGIISVLLGASLGGYSSMTRRAERAKCQELVSNTATALASLFSGAAAWPKAIRTHDASSGGDGLLNEDAAYPLASSGAMTLTYDSSERKLKGLDRFGVVTPWAMAVIKRKGSQASLSDVVNTSKYGSFTIQDHILHYAVDLDGDGIIKGVDVGGETVSVRAPVMVWCGGKDGKILPYTKGLKSDDVYSWTRGQTRNVD